ncbi:MAG TPA: type II toxin-antitoxin system RelE/ParE family toxin [Rhizomicrobium sp.]|nr:type II toxin-antitoxin system RelE/ParE family toxin [Rhizomicrobium sp.]
MRLVLLATARGDLKSVARYSEKEWGRARKSQYMAALRARLVALLEHQKLGIARPDLGAGYRSLLVGSHVVFYRLAASEVRVVRVLHQRMDPKRHLPQPLGKDRGSAIR